MENKFLQRNLKLFYIFNFLIDFRLYAPIAILYFAEVSGSYTLGMSIFSIIFISQTLFEVPTGLFSDRIERRKTMIVGAICSVTAITLYATGFSYWFLALGATMEGLARSFFSGTSSALLFETLKSMKKENQFAEYKGKTSSMFQLALALAALIGGAVAGFISLQMAVILSVIPQILCFLTTLFFLEPTFHKYAEKDIWGDLRKACQLFMTNPKLRLISIAGIASFAFGQASHQFETAFFKTVMPVWLIGVARMVSHACAGVSFWFSGKMITLFGHYKVLMGGNLLGIVLTSIAVFLNSIISPFLIAFTSISFGSGMVANDDLTNREFSDAQRATMGSLISLAGSLMFAIIAPLLGYIADVTHPGYALLTGLTGSVISMIIYSRVYSKYNI